MEVEMQSSRDPASMLDPTCRGSLCLVLQRVVDGGGGGVDRMRSDGQGLRSWMRNLAVEMEWAKEVMQLLTVRLFFMCM